MIMSEEKPVVNVIGRIYTHFLYRDLTYVAGGLLILSIPIYAHGILSTLVNAPWWVVIVPIVLAAYATGFFAQEAAVLLGAYRMFSRRGSTVDQEVKYLKVTHSIRATFGEESLLRLERTIALKHLSAVLGSSSLMALVLLQLYYWTGHIVLAPFLYHLFSVSFLCFSLVMSIRNRRLSDVQDRFLKGLSQGTTDIPTPPRT